MVIIKAPTPQVWFKSPCLWNRNKFSSSNPPLHSNIQPAPRLSCCDLQGKGHVTVGKSQRHHRAGFSREKDEGWGRFLEELVKLCRAEHEAAVKVGNRTVACIYSFLCSEFCQSSTITVIKMQSVPVTVHVEKLQLRQTQTKSTLVATWSPSVKRCSGLQPSRWRSFNFSFWQKHFQWERCEQNHPEMNQNPRSEFQCQCCILFNFFYSHIFTHTLYMHVHMGSHLLTHWADAICWSTVDEPAGGSSLISLSLTLTGCDVPVSWGREWRGSRSACQLSLPFLSPVSPFHSHPDLHHPCLQTSLCYSSWPCFVALCTSSPLKSSAIN